MKVKFWGVRGTNACPSDEYREYGGNTSCVSIEAGSDLVICDAGTGIFNLGKWMGGQPYDIATLLFSHVHIDHIAGFPAFRQAWDANFKLDIYAAHLKDSGGIKENLRQQFSPPFFPVGLEMMQAHMDFHDFDCGDSFDVGTGIHIKTAPLNHPNNATGYRIEHKGKSVCYITDTEHVPGEIDTNILNLVRGSDLMIYDATFTDEEYEEYKGWGHSTWKAGMQLAQIAGVKQYCIFHHNPDHDDEHMRQIETEATDLWDKVFVARQGMELIL